MDGQRGHAVRVLVVDDQDGFRRAAVGIVTETPGLEVCGDTSCAHEVPGLVETLRPHLVLLDVRMAAEDPLAVAMDLVCHRSDVAILLTSAFSRDDVPRECFDLGMGFLPKEDLAPDTLLDAARSLVRGPQA